MLSDYLESPHSGQDLAFYKWPDSQGMGWWWLWQPCKEQQQPHCYTLMSTFSF